MIHFLLDENLPVSVARVFERRGFTVECVSECRELRGKSDEVIFDYALKHKAIIVTRDLDFVDPLRFALEESEGLVIVRFHTTIHIKTLCEEIGRLLADLSEQDFKRTVLVFEPRLVRARKL